MSAGPAPDLSMTDRLQTGIDYFNRGLWFEAHEVWEDLWNQTRGESRDFYQGLIQAAVGLHHLSHGNVRGGRRVLERGLVRLEAYPGCFAGIDNERLTGELRAALEVAAGTSAGGFHAIRIRRSGP